MRHISKIGIMLFAVAVVATAIVAGWQAPRFAQRRLRRGSAPPKRQGRPKYRKPRSICK